MVGSFWADRILTVPLCGSDRKAGILCFARTAAMRGQEKWGSFRIFCWEIADALGIRRLTVPAHKDDTDTQLAIEEAISRGCTQLTLVGGFGGRVDHFGANLLQLEGYRRRGVKIRLMNGQNRVRCAISESVTL